MAMLHLDIDFFGAAMCAGDYGRGGREGASQTVFRFSVAQPFSALSHPEIACEPAAPAR